MGTKLTAYQIGRAAFYRERLQRQIIDNGANVLDDATYQGYFGMWGQHLRAARDIFGEHPAFA